jgi:hypothetical protein
MASGNGLFRDELLLELQFGRLRQGQHFLDFRRDMEIVMGIIYLEESIEIHFILQSIIFCKFFQFCISQGGIKEYSKCRAIQNVTQNFALVFAERSFRGSAWAGDHQRCCSLHDRNSRIFRIGIRNRKGTCIQFNMRRLYIDRAAFVGKNPFRAVLQNVWKSQVVKPEIFKHIILWVVLHGCCWGNIPSNASRKQTSFGLCASHLDRTSCSV